MNFRFAFTPARVCSLCCSAAIVLTLAPASHAAQTIGDWIPLFEGVDFATGFGDTPRREQMQAIRIDLTAPGIGFTTTPSSAAQYPGFETFSQTTGDFLLGQGAQVAINANFFSTVSTTAQPQNLSGLAISKGTLVSAAEAAFPALLLTQQNAASITTTPAGFNPAGTWNAVAGSSIILQNGVAVTPAAGTAGDPANPNPRTAVGLSQDGRYLYMLTLDGRQAGYSLGATQAETGTWLASFGAYTGLNLDGGGSTALVRADGRGGALTMNRPSDGTQRLNGNNLGVFAQPLQHSLSYASTVLQDGPVAWYRLNESTGTVAADSSGHGNNGSYGTASLKGRTDSPIMSESPSSVAISTTAGSRVTVPYDAELNPEGSFTIAAWAKPTGASDGQFGALISARDDGAGGNSDNTGFILYEGPADSATGDRWQFWIGGSTADTYNFLGRNRSGYLLGPQVEINEWAYIVGTFTATSGPDATGRFTGTQSLYVDGQLALSLDNIKYLPNSDEDLYLGAGANEAAVDSFRFTGLLDDIAIYDYALSAAEIMNQFQVAAAPVPEPATALVWHLPALLIGGMRRWRVRA